jgi:hypothetical protein
MRWFICLAVVLATSVLIHVDAIAQTEPQKRPGPAPQTTPIPPTAPAQAGPAGAPDEGVDVSRLKADVDSTVARMAVLTKQSAALSASFARLAALHHGADRAEILMMQRVSDAMGTMAGEVETTLVQYKRMLDDETDLETGAMRSEVDGLHGVMEVIAGEVDDALKTMLRLEAQLGQG